jgi:aromatic ring-opening dioxygenase catalytic subunit (LigB family)
MRMPAIYLPHGGGPWPWVDADSIATRDEKRSLTGYLTGILGNLPRRPKALLVVSAHWEEPVATVMTSPHPPLYYDYAGFPPQMYEIPWPAPGQPDLAAQVQGLLDRAEIPNAGDGERGYDHGTFVPLKLTAPDADIPTVQLSLEESLDPARHIAIGRALQSLRDEDVLLVGSGMSFHNLSFLHRPIPRGVRCAKSKIFDTWLQQAVVGDASARDRLLIRWTEAPGARGAHPRAEHLVPLMVMAGAAGEDRGSVAFHDTFAGFHVSAVHFGG